MRFSVLPTACLFLAAVVKAQEPYTAVAKDIKLLTSKANTLITSASEMTVVNVATTTGPVRLLPFTMRRSLERVLRLGSRKC